MIVMRRVSADEIRGEETSDWASVRECHPSVSLVPGACLRTGLADAQ